MKKVIITADASSRGNGQTCQTRAAAAAILSYQGHLRAVACYLGNLTNQQAEVTACALGLEALKEPCEVTLQTDSRYVVETMNGGFRRKTNFEFWERLDRAARPHKVTWVWVKGHAGHREQEAADRLAHAISQAGVVTPLALEETVNHLRGRAVSALVAAA